MRPRDLKVVGGVDGVEVVASSGDGMASEIEEV
jgi:hypothetical protein